MNKSAASRTRRLLPCLLVAVALGVISPPVGAQPSRDGSTAPPSAPEPRAQASRRIALARSQLQEARRLDAHKNLPESYREVEDALARAEEALAAHPEATSGPAVDLAEAAAVRAARLLGQARFVEDLRAYRNPWEEVAARFDRALQGLAGAAGYDLEPGLAGTAAVHALMDYLGRQRLRQQVQSDSLSLANRRLEQDCAGRMAAQDSLATALQVELSTLRRSLWETQLRAGMAEADRSAAESDLQQVRERQAAVRSLGAQFGPDEAEVLLTPQGDIIIHVFGLAFGVGSAQLQEEHAPLLDKLAAAVERFPDRRLRVEGHTDDTGGREANLRLSRRRAETVASLLASRLGRDPGSIETEGVGPDRPIASNATPEGRARNRRIDLILLQGR
jgi:outer membrane protein OmpA-like peptidoglycan-associated protein